MMNEARDLATDRMIEDAQNMGADAVINVRYSSQLCRVQLRSLFMEQL